MTEHKTAFLVKIYTSAPPEETDLERMSAALQFGLEMAKAQDTRTTDRTLAQILGYRVRPAKEKTDPKEFAEELLQTDATVLNVLASSEKGPSNG